MQKATTFRAIPLNFSRLKANLGKPKCTSDKCQALTLAVVGWAVEAELASSVAPLENKVIYQLYTFRDRHQPEEQ